MKKQPGLDMSYVTRKSKWLGTLNSNSRSLAYIFLRSEYKTIAILEFGMGLDL